tara:strand:+ start:62 stop:337 length:276 start_codon:yes stop_codon:yes gene_type:complete
MQNIDMSYEGLVERAKQYLGQMIIQSEKAPTKASYNKLLGGWTTSKRDVIMACTMNLKNLNTVSQTLYGKDVVSFNEEETKLPDIKINEDK